MGVAQNLSMNKDLIIGESRIDKQGVFANRDFKKGEVVLKWNIKLIKENEIGRLSPEEKTYVSELDGKSYMPQLPDRLVNHSCESNTKSKNRCDVAVRNIKKGEEITADYNETGGQGFECKCGGKNCQGRIN